MRGDAPARGDDTGADGRLLSLVMLLHLPLAARAVYLMVRDLVLPEAVASTDFSVFWTGWWLILHGRAPSLYDAAAQQAAQRVVMGGAEFEGGLMAFLNPPHVALAGLPFGWLADHAGGHAAFLVWSALNLALLARLDWLVRDTLGLRAGRARWLATEMLLAFYPVLYTVSVGQISLLLAVAAFELARALERRRAVAAAAWLLVLSAKPQLVPPLLVFLIARRHLRALAAAAVGGVVVVAATAAALGPSIWSSYVRSVHALERFFGTGTVAYMMNVRGQLARLLGGGVGGEAAVDTVANVVWLLALAGLAAALWIARRAPGDRAPAHERGELALTLAVALLASPHLFSQDATLWVVVFALQLAALRARGEPTRPLATFALCWPLLFGVARIADLYGTRTPRLPVNPLFVAMLAATVAIARATLWRPRRPPSP